MCEAPSKGSTLPFAPYSPALRAPGTKIWMMPIDIQYLQDSCSEPKRVKDSRSQNSASSAVPLGAKGSITSRCYGACTTTTT